MIRKYGFGLLAMLIAIVAVSFTTITNAGHSPKTSFFYRYDGAVGGESTMSNWTSIATYASATCVTGSVRGCKIENTTSSAGHPTSVPLSATTHLPITSGTLQPAVENKNN